MAKPFLTVIRYDWLIAICGQKTEIISENNVL